MLKTLVAAAAALVIAAPAYAEAAKPATTVMCIEVSGREIPPLCNVPASRLDKSEYICTCPAGGQRVAVPVCGKGEQQPGESRALERWRNQASRDGSLVGDLFEGKPACRAPRQP